MEKGFYHPTRGYWQTTGVPPEEILAAYPEGTVEVPLKPGADFELRGDKWVEVLPDPADARAAKRAGQFLTRRQTFIGMHRRGLITAQEAVAGAKDGTVPAALEPIFAAMPEPDQTDARITFATFTRAERLDPMTLILQQTGKVSDAEMDRFFDTFAGV